MRSLVAPLLLLGPFLLGSPAAAELAASGPDGFTSRSEALIAKPPAEVWAALTSWGQWWDPAHSYSGKPGSLSLDAKAGGQLLERWDGGTVLHATVLSAMPGRLLRLEGGFGPLQSLPVNAVLSFALKAEGEHTRLTMTYGVGGPASLKLDNFAAPVDSVMTAGFQRLTRHATTGTPTAP